MKILKLLSNKFFLFLLIFTIFFFNKTLSNEPVDIWNLENNENLEIKDKKSKEVDKVEQKKKQIETLNKENKDPSIELDETLLSKKIEIVGIYDPTDNDLSMDMWSNSNGLEILNLFDKIQSKNLSQDAREILNITLLTNSYFPKKNISSEEFLKIKSKWLIKQGDLNLIKEYLKKNKDLEQKNNLIEFYLNQYLSKGDITNACSILKDLIQGTENIYFLKFNIYCLVNNGKNEEAQLQLDLLKEKNFKDKLFEKRIFYLLGYNSKIEEKISENSLLDFHLSHITNPNFKFEPKENTKKLIWKYLSSFNLLASIENVDLENKDKILLIEKAVNEKNYTEEELFNFYRRFTFNINQLLTVEQSFKILPNHQARALLYQGILISKSFDQKIKLIKQLKDLFIQDDISFAFDSELIRLLKTIDRQDVPYNYSKFYDESIKDLKIKKGQIKFNNKIIHQSKLLNYFIEDSPNQKIIEKDINNTLKKKLKKKDYFVSIKDIILIESLKSDQVKISKRYLDKIELDQADIPLDIQILINNKETGLVLLRLVEIIGQDTITDMGSETLYFIVSALNQLNIDKLRNKILLKVLPLKV